MTSIDFRSGWLCAAPKDPPTWKIAIASALTHTGALDLDLMLRTVPPTPDDVVGREAQRELQPPASEFGTQSEVGFTVRL